jgi:hypothetical protein
VARARRSKTRTQPGAEKMKRVPVEERMGFRGHFFLHDADDA